jgi:hypothetical protein
MTGMVIWFRENVEYIYPFTLFSLWLFKSEIT